MRRSKGVVCSLVVAGVLSLAAPAMASPAVEVPGGETLHFWAAASADMRQAVSPGRALADLRDLYRQESRILEEYTTIGGFHVYDPDATGKLWAVHQLIARRERTLGLRASDWDLPANTAAVTPDDYPSRAAVADAIGRIPLPEGALDGLPVFLAPMDAPKVSSWAVSYGAPWLDEAIVLLSGTEVNAFVHELGHVVHRQILQGSSGLQSYIDARSAEKALTGRAWADSVAENIAEDFRTYALGSNDHLGSWGTPTSAEQTMLGDLLATGRQHSPLVDFSVADSRSGRHWQPLTGLTFVTDEAQITLRTEGFAGPLQAKLCEAEQCIGVEGVAPLAIPIPQAGTYTLTVAVDGDAWMQAQVTRVDPPEAEVKAEAKPCKPELSEGMTVSEFLRQAAVCRGWGEFPLPATGLLGNGWDRDPAARALAWARLTGAVDPLFAWRHRPGEPIPTEIARKILPTS